MQYFTLEQPISCSNKEVVDLMVVLIQHPTKVLLPSKSDGTKGEILVGQQVQHIHSLSLSYCCYNRFCILNNILIALHLFFEALILL